MAEHYDALQEQILSLFEEERTDIDSQIKYWQLERRSKAILYYARKHGMTRLGLQPLPALVASEYQGKEAIAMTMLLTSLKNSPFADESWTLSDTSTELVRANDPKNCFKKHGYTVNVWFDMLESNAYPYTNWRRIYVQDDNEQWYVTEGQVDYNGLFFIDIEGNKSYFTLFANDAPRFGTTGKWTVHYDDHTLTPPVFTSRTSGSSEVILIDSDDDEQGPSTSRDPGPSLTRPNSPYEPEKEGEGTGERTPESQATLGVQRRRGQGKSSPGSRSPVKRAKADSSGGQGGGFRRGGARGRRGSGDSTGSPPSVGAIGKRHRTVTERGLSRLRRLQEEARDPPIIVVQGPPNCLKCWRYRLRSHSSSYLYISTVFKWIDLDGYGPKESRLLISFKSSCQRQIFLSTTKIPRNCTYSLGNLNAL